MSKAWNNENASKKKDELYALPDRDREAEAQLIRDDLKSWALNNFTFSQKQKDCMDLMPPEYYEHAGYNLARAIEKKYPLYIRVSDDSKPPAQRRRDDSISGGWSEQSGFNISYEWNF